MADFALIKEVDLWVSENRRSLNEDAIRILRCMSPEDQRRVLGGGPLQLSKDMVALLRGRSVMGREREQQLAERKGVDASRFAKAASEDEVEQWVETNRQYLDEAAMKEFIALSADDKWRVISEGGLREAVDAAFVIEKRAERTKELSTQVAAMFAARREQLEASKAKAAPLEIKVAPRVAAAMQEVYASYVGREVPAHLRRCGGYQNVEPEPELPPLVGTVKGVGGVIEILKQKYGCSKGQRLKVIGEQGGPAGMWRLEDAKTVPKTHLKDGGWRWAMDHEEPPKKAVEPKPPEAARSGPAAASPSPEDRARPGSRGRSSRAAGSAAGSEAAARSRSPSSSDAGRKKPSKSRGKPSQSRDKSRGKRKGSRSSSRSESRSRSRSRAASSSSGRSGRGGRDRGKRRRK